MAVLGNNEKAAEATAPDLSKLLAGGFASLTSILTFFGLKDGYLDRVLVSEPYAALVVFILVAVGLIGSISAPKIGPSQKIQIWVPLLVVFMLLGSTGLVIPNVPNTAGVSPIVWIAGVVGVVLAIAIGVAIVKREHAVVSVPAAVLIVAAVAQGIGLYGAVKVGVLSKNFSTAVTIDATVAHTPQTPTATIEVKIEALRVSSDEVLELSILNEAATTRASVIVVPAVGGKIDRTYTFRVPATDELAYLTIRSCTATDTPKPDTTSDSSMPTIPHEPVGAGALNDSYTCTKPDTYEIFAVRAGALTEPPTTTTTTPPPTTTIPTTTTTRPAPPDCPCEQKWHHRP